MGSERFLALTPTQAAWIREWVLMGMEDVDFFGDPISVGIMGHLAGITHKLDGMFKEWELDPAELSKEIRKHCEPH